MKHDKKTVILIAMIFCIILALLATNIPFTESQFYAQNTDLNYQIFLAGGYDGKCLAFDENILTIKDCNASVGTNDWNNLTGFPTGCPPGEAVQIIGTTLTCIPIGSVDLNGWQFYPDANTLCTGDGFCGDFNGQAGPQGPQGPPGSTGSQGPQGIQGAPGPNIDTNWQTSWNIFDVNMSAQYKKCSPSTELCYDNIDNDCDGLTDCADATDCPSSSYLCKQPIGILVSEIVGGANALEIATTSAATNYNWERQTALVIRNNSGSRKTITQIDINGYTYCIDREAEQNFCNGTQLTGTSENLIIDTPSVASPTTGYCSPMHGLLQATPLTVFTRASNPWDAVIISGTIDEYSWCTKPRTPIILKPNEETSILLERTYPDWCLGDDWENVEGATVGLKIHFLDGTTQNISGLGTTCRQAVNGYAGSFFYTNSLGFGGFPTAWLPSGGIGTTQGSPPTYKLTNTDYTATAGDTTPISLLSFSMAASKAYGFDCYLTTYASIWGEGIWTSMHSSQAPTYVAYTITGWTDETTTVTTAMNSYDAYPEYKTSQGRVNRIYEIRGSVLNGAGAASIVPMFTNSGTEENSVTIKQGSWCVYTTLGS